LAREELDRQDLMEAGAALAEPGESIPLREFMKQVGD